MTLTRRTLLSTAALLGGLAAVGCSSAPQSVEVFTTWSGSELAQFEEVLRAFSDNTSYRVRVVPVGEQVQELLRARVAAGNPPDVAIVPLIGLIRAYAQEGRVTPVDAVIDSSSLSGLLPGLREAVTVDGKTYAVWVKTAHKSMFWYRPTALVGRQTPNDWGELVQLVRDLAQAGTTPLSVGMADGWVATDWFENALIGAGGDEVYAKLSQGDVDGWAAPVVGDALRALAELWSIEGAFPHGPTRALVTQYEESVVSVFGTLEASMVYEGDFVQTVINRFGTGTEAQQARTFPFPPSHAASPPLVVAGDIAALMNPTPGGRALIRWLAQPRSWSPWLARGGFLSPYASVPPAEHHPKMAELARSLHSARRVHVDLSDVLSGMLAGGQGRGMERILQQFFAEVTMPHADHDAAVRRAQDQLRTAALLTEKLRRDG